MIKGTILSIFILVAGTAMAQVQTQLIGDSVFIHSNTGKGELIIQNSTDTIKGFLFNKGEGRTEFRKILLKINDTTYVLGLDTLYLYNNGSLNTWNLTGNAGTTDSNFVGTTDNTPLYFRVNNQSAGFIEYVGRRNQGMGINTLRNLTTGNSNTAFGYEALYADTSGNNNTAIGRQSLTANSNGYENTATGYYSLYSNTSGYRNTANGAGSLAANITGSNNAAHGYRSLHSNTSGSNNTASGVGSIYSNTTGTSNTGIGFNSLYFNTTGKNNSANGAFALYSNTSGIDNTAIGYYSLYSNTTGNYNTASGFYSLRKNTTGQGNTANGFYSLSENTTGNSNASYGYYSLSANTSGSANTGSGARSLYYNTTGSENTAIGTSALESLTTGNGNVALGAYALKSITTEQNNIGLGINSAKNITGINNTLFVSDSTFHMYFKLDSAFGIPPSVIGKDANGYWHVYQPAIGGGGSSLTLTTTGNNGPATLNANILNIPEYLSPIASTHSIGLVSVGQGLVIDSTGELSTTIGLLTKGSVPYASTEGTLIEDATGLSYDGNNLKVGHSDFYSTTGISLNGGRGYMGASGFGLTFKTNGGKPMDASKSITFYNSDSRYGVMGMRSVSDSTLRFLVDMEIVPSSNNKYNLGSASNQWNRLYVNQLYLNGELFDGVMHPPVSGTATLVNGTVTVLTSLVENGAKIFVSVDTPGGTQGFLSAPSASIVDGVSFVINSTSATETSTVNWQIIN